jgi:hypothetical protein
VLGSALAEGTAEETSAEAAAVAEDEGVGAGSTGAALAGALVVTGLVCGFGSEDVGAGRGAAETDATADLLLAEATHGFRLRITSREMQARAATVPLMTATSFRRLTAASGKGGGISCVVRLTELTEDETPSAPSRTRSGAPG